MSKETKNIYEIRNKRNLLRKLDKFSFEVTKEEALLLFDKVKIQYNVKTPNELIDLFKNGRYEIPGEVIAIMKIIS